MTNKELIAENDRLKKLAEQLQAQNASLQAEVKTAKKEPEAIEGTFTAKWKTPRGGNKTRKIGFKAGHKFLWINGFKVPTKEVLAIANGKEIPEDIAKEFPWLNQDKLTKHLNHLAKIDYGGLRDVE